MAVMCTSNMVAASRSLVLAQSGKKSTLCANARKSPPLSRLKMLARDAFDVIYPAPTFAVKKSFTLRTKSNSLMTATVAKSGGIPLILSDNSRQIRRMSKER